MQPLTLMGSTGSPYARKVRVALIEKKVEFRWVEAAVPSVDLLASPQVIRWTMVNEKHLTDLNPLGKIPVFLHDGCAWFDSSVILEYIEWLIPEPPLISSGLRGLAARNLEALSDRLCDVVGYVLAGKRRGTYSARDEQLTLTLEKSIKMNLISMSLCYNAYSRADETETSLAEIAIGVALSYLEYRMPLFKWRDVSPTLDCLYVDLIRRTSFLATSHPKP